MSVQETSWVDVCNDEGLEDIQVLVPFRGVDEEMICDNQHIASRLASKAPRMIGTV